MLNVIPKEGGNRFTGTLSPAAPTTTSGRQHVRRAQRPRARLPTAARDGSMTSTSVLAGPIVKDKLWFMTAHRRWGREERIANLFHDLTMNDPLFTPADGTNGRPFEPGATRRRISGRTTSA